MGGNEKADRNSRLEGSPRLARLMLHVIAPSLGKFIEQSKK